MGWGHPHPATLYSMPPAILNENGWTRCPGSAELSDYFTEGNLLYSLAPSVPPERSVAGATASLCRGVCSAGERS